MDTSRILVVENEPVVALHLRQTLIRFGYEVSAVVASGEQCLRHIETARPDLILMDINIDGAMDGISTAASIPAEYDIPVIYLTAYSGDETISRACATNPYGYMVKPFAEREVHTMIQTALSRSRGQKAMRAREDQQRRIWKMEMSGQLAGRVAQDFNNLLAVIFNDLDELRGHADARPEAAELIKRIELAAGRAERLASRLRTFAGQSDVLPTAISISQFMTSMMPVLHRELGGAIRTNVSLPDDLWGIWVDSDEFELALMNLVTNARAAMPAGGLLEIEATNVTLNLPMEEALATPERFRRHVRLRISDTGIGMPKSVVERAFEPFFRGTPDGQGTGLGLSQVFGFVRQSSGQLSIASEVGRGTIVELQLPAVPMAEADIQARETDGQAGASADGGARAAIAAAPVKHDDIDWNHSGASVHTRSVYQEMRRLDMERTDRRSVAGSR
jgi:signal transduction histidine kinase